MCQKTLRQLVTEWLASSGLPCQDARPDRRHTTLQPCGLIDLSARLNPQTREGTRNAPHDHQGHQTVPEQSARSPGEGGVHHPRRDLPRHRSVRGGDEGGLRPHPAPRPLGAGRRHREAAPQEADDGLGAAQGPLAEAAQRPLPELGQEPRRRLAGHRRPRHRRPRRGGLRPRLHRPRRLDGRHQRQQAGAPLPHGRREGHAAHRHERLRRRLRPGRRGRPRRLRRGLHRAPQDQRRGPVDHVHVRLQRRRRLLPAAPGQLRHPAAATPSSA